MIKSIITSSFVSLLLTAQGLILTPLLIKSIGASAYGVYIIILPIIGVIYSFSSFGVNIKAKRFLVSEKNKLKKSYLFYNQFWLHLSIALLVAILFVIMLTLLSVYFNELNFYYVIYLFLSYLICNQLLDFYRYTGQMKVYNSVVLIIPYSLILLFLINYNYKIFSSLNDIIYASIIINMIASSAMFIFLYRSIGFKLTLPSLNQMAMDVKFGLPLVLSGSIGLILPLIERLIISFNFDYVHVTIYACAFTVGAFAMLMANAIVLILTPKLFYFRDTGKCDEAAKVLHNAYYLFLIFAIPYFAGTIVYGEDILKIYTSTEIGYKGAAIIPIIALASLFGGLVVINLTIAMAENINGKILKTNFISSIAFILVTFLTTYFLNNILCVALSFLAMNIFNYFAFQKMTKFSVLFFNPSLCINIRMLIGGFFVMIMGLIFKSFLIDVGPLLIFAQIFTISTLYFIFLYADIKKYL